jgi:hypothetical protein
MHRVAETLLTIVDRAFTQLRGISEETSALRPAPRQWSKKEIIGHLIDSAANNHQRFIRAQQCEELVFPPYDQERWVELNDYQGHAWQDMLAFWKLYNVQVARTICRIPNGKGSTICRIGSNPPVTLQYLAEDYVAHMRHHFKQLGLSMERWPAQAVASSSPPHVPKINCQPVKKRIV